MNELTPLPQLGVLLAAIVTAGCSSPSVWPEGTAVLYEVEIGGRKVGDVTVWSQGPPWNSGDLGLAGDPQGFLQLGVRVRNDGPSALRFDGQGAELEVRTEEASYVLERPVRVLGNLEVAPGLTETIALVYALPAGVTVVHLLRYELAWAVEGRVSRSTAFMREGGQGYTLPGFGAWGHDPWGPWGWRHFGF